MSSLPAFVRLESELLTLILDCTGKTPALLYFGKKLTAETDPVSLKALVQRQEAKCSVVVEAPISLSPLSAEGFTGSPGIELHDDDIAWSFGPELVDVSFSKPDTVVLTSVDQLRQLQIVHTFALDFASNVLAAASAITNLGPKAVQLNWCAAPTLLLPDHLTQVTGFEGRWSNEFQQHRLDLYLGSYFRENRKGKTSHDNFPGVLVHQANTNEQAGECYGFHLGWSGNHRTRVELLAEGRCYLQMGELLLPGELSLAPQASYQSPTLFTSYSPNGFSALSANFHQFVRAHLLSSAQRQKPRPVHYNTWEGIYFEHDVDTLKQLAENVAELGVERFVLDDGWFKGRRNDRAGLGDWVVDKTVYPDGLQPLITHVNKLGMEFGIWFEPEMVNPDSDLYRQHPDWILSTKNNSQLQFRNQLVLDLTRTEVTDYLYSSIQAILQEYPAIKYIKWDINRDLNHPGDANGKPAIHRQTLALYQLIARIKAANPGLEIESCSSGGARIDYGVLGYTDRVWTSDSNDALDRLAIQRGCSFFFPSDVMGAHVGPRDCHITGRRISMDMRAAVAFFGHMGIEMDPRELTEPEKQTLKAAIALHKEYRNFIHNARLHRMDGDGLSINFGLVNQQQTQGLFAYNSVIESGRTLPKRLRFVGLDANKMYQFKLLWPTQLKEHTPSLLGNIQLQSFSGASLMQQGMQLPITLPQTSLIFALNAI
ncbi:MAG: alpha-galactosidase [Paraglaciecola sp.]|nr:alpha-galactosidase [Paraglaciecola sp.]